jgi:hypothetical protein
VNASFGSTSSTTVGQVEQLAMATTTRGLLLIGGSTGSECTVSVSATRNGSRTFSNPIRIGESSCEDENERLVVGSTGIAVAYGMLNAISDDWGVTWTPVHVGGRVVGASVSQGSVWVSRLKCLSATSEQCSLLIYVSSNGGMTWNQTIAQPNGARAWNGLESVPATTVLLRSPMVGFVFSAPSTQLRPIHHIHEWSTFNGGKSWSSGIVDCAQGVFNGLVVSKLTSGALVALCAGQPFTGYQAKSVSISNDRDTSWSAEPANGLGSKFVVGYADSIGGPTQRTFYEFGEEGPLHVTHDGGATWTDLGTFGVVSTVPSSVQFVNSKWGFAIGAIESPTSNRTAIWVTKNSGRTWTDHIIVGELS